MSHISRRAFLGALAITALSARASLARTRAPRPQHPDPRPGITGAKVATKEQLEDSAEIVPLFDDVRAMPEIADGIRCHCGCADQPGFRSLLSCYEGAEAMARECHTCQGQARLAARLKKEGKSLEEIRAAIDAKFS